MTIEDIERKQLIFINYIQSLVNSSSSNTWKVKAEYNTNDNDSRVIIVQEQTGEKIVFYGNCIPLFNYYSITIYGLSIQENKNLSLILGNLIGQDSYINTTYTNNGVTYNEKWQIIFKQFINPQTIEYKDIRRVGYNMTFKVIVNKIASIEN
jgi:hypothetical protein